MLEMIDDAEVYTIEGMDGSPTSQVNISDVIEVIETDQMLTGEGGGSDPRRPRPYVKILEQPASKALRFRYECEGRSAGSIPGVSSTPENKTFPTIQIVGYQGRAVVVVSCVTKDSPYRPHPHNLVGKEGCSRGVCTLKMNSDTISFSNLGIQCVKKKDIEEALKVREEIRVDPFRTGFSHRVQQSNIDLNSVRLCFQVFLEGPKKDEFTIPLKPVVSNTIYDKKAMSDLTICKLSDCSASVAGGREIILLCEKVAKEDIQVRFYEEQDGEVVWESLGDFQPTHVHKQVAIAFRTPKYRDLEVERPVRVCVQLRRPSDGALSEPLKFTMTPLDAEGFIKRKRHKLGGESSPQNILRPAHDEDSRSTYVGSMSPDRMQMLQVKREPQDACPPVYSYAAGGSISPMYPGASPGPPSPHNNPSPGPYSPYPQYLNQINVRLPAGGGLVDLNPAAPGAIFSEPATLNNLNSPGTFTTAQPTLVTPNIAGKHGIKMEGDRTMLDMDSQSLEFNLSNLDSGELTRMLTDANLSANLSSNLTLSERLDGDRPHDQGMTDSFTRAANNAIQELVSLGSSMYPPPPPQ